jgi:hypothetical protein
MVTSVKHGVLTCTPEAAGRYFFGDFIRSRVWSIGPTIGQDGTATASARTEYTADLGGPTALADVASFGMDARRELYIVSCSRGAILRIVGPPSTPTGLR